MSAVPQPFPWQYRPLSIDWRHCPQEVEIVLDEYRQRCNAWRESKEHWDKLFSNITKARERDMEGARIAVKKGETAPSKTEGTAQRAHKDYEMTVIAYAAACKDLESKLLKVAGENRRHWAENAHRAAEAEFAELADLETKFFDLVDRLGRSSSQVVWALKPGPLSNVAPSQCKAPSDEVEATQRWLGQMEPRPLPDSPEAIQAKEAAAARRNQKKNFSKMAVKSTARTWG